MVPGCTFIHSQINVTYRLYEDTLPIILTQKFFPADQHLSFLGIAVWERENKPDLVWLLL